MLEEKSGTGRDRVTLVASSNNDEPRGLFPHPLPSPGGRGGVGSLARFIDRNPGAAVTLEIYCSANVQTEPFFGTPVRRGSPE